MNVIEIVGRNADGSEGPKRIPRFPTGADFRLEILPSIFKAEMFAGTSLVWIDMGVDFNRKKGTCEETRRCRIPVRICCSGFSARVSGVLYSCLKEGTVMETARNGNIFVRLLENVKREDADTSNTTDAENSNESRTEIAESEKKTFNIKPVRTTNKVETISLFVGSPTAPKKLASLCP